jgi:hypothetical protein
MCHLSPLQKIRYLLVYSLLSICVLPFFTNALQAEDSIYAKSRDFTAEDLIRGERLFYGLVYPDNRSINCAGCHNTRFSDTLNWNPNALEISEKYLNKTAKDLSRILINPSGKKMVEVHKGFLFSPEDVMLIKAYMDKFPGIGLKQDKPVVTNIILFIIASLLFLFSGFDQVISKKLKKQWIHFAILTLTGTFITYSLVFDALAIGRSQDYSPDQPVKFSHAVHAGQNGTNCFYCHSSAQYSKSAGIPAENICMNCHLVVRNGTRSGAFEIAKIIEAYESKKPFEWIKVYNLPDHVFFSHAQHVSAGGISCQQCHGPVEEMNRIRQVPDLSMGWCINCHRSTKVNFNSNKFYSEYKDLSGRMKKGGIDSVTVEMIGGTECMKCHY